MASTNKTTNLKLSQFVGSDIPDWGEDYNEDMRKIDTALSPTGAVSMFAGSAEPNGWLLCNGQAVNRDTYARLFATIGTTYGVGDGSATFNVPDMRGAFPLGANSNLGTKGGSATQAYAIDSENTSALFVVQDGTVRMDAEGPVRHFGESIVNIGAGVEVTGIVGGTTPRVVGTTVEGNNMPPYLAVNFIIKT
ncbi:phage tail protein [Ruminococcaceae bacterium OttesenSCG-928-D13]|nr:phage tail protein [Ruminococcaceae bacterium OttesenSCG-928-D13]